MHKRFKQGQAVAAALLSSMILVACGGGDDNTSTTAASSSSAAASSVAVSSAATSSAAASSAAASSAAASSAAASSAAASSAAASSAAASSAAASSAAASSAASSTAAIFAAADLDTAGYFWFSNTNAANYLVGETLSSGTIYSLDPAATVNAGEFIYGNPNTIAAGTTSAAWNSALAPTGTGLTFTKSGGLTIPKASAAGGTDGGSAVFKLPSLTSFLAFTATTGSLYYAVDTSTDGSTWTEKYTSGTTKVRSAGESTEDIGTKAGASSSKIYVRIRNLGTGGLNVMGVQIK